MSLWIPIAIFLLAQFAAATPAEHQPLIHDIKVTAERYPHANEHSPGSIRVISQEELAAKCGNNLGQALNEVSGLTVNTAGGSGQQTDIFIRGSSSAQVLVLVDGIPLNDPSSPGRSVDFSNFNLDNVEHIEILKGPQSALYGSQAMAGVVKIITKRGRGPLQISLNPELISPGGAKGLVSIVGGDSKRWYSCSLAHQEVQSFSAEGRAYPNTPQDRSKATTVASKIGAALGDASELELSLRGSHQQTHVDKFAGPGGFDPNYFVTNEVLAVKIANRNFFLSEQVEVDADFEYSSFERLLRNEADFTGDSDLSDTTYYGATHTLNLSSHFTRKKNISSLGVSAAQESFKTLDRLLAGGNSSLQDAQDVSLYVQQYLEWGSFFATTTGRLEQHSRAGFSPTYRLAPGIDFGEGLIGKASFGTGVKAPSLFQLYSLYGDDTLGAEKSLGGDLSLSKTFSRGDRLAVTFFATKVSDKVDYASQINKYQNIGKTATKGLEFESLLVLPRQMKASAVVTIQEGVNLSTGERLLRSPKIFGTMAWSWQPQRWTLRPSYRFVGARKDVNVDLPAYAVCDFSVNHQLSSQLGLYANLYNLTRENYEEIAGYRAPGLWGLVGALWTF